MRRHRRQAAALALTLVALAFALRPGRDAAWATLFLLDFLAAGDSALYARLTTAPVVTADSLHGPDRAAVPYDLYRPAGERPPRAAVVLTHGMAHRGRRDPRVREQAERFARAGYLVLAPDLLRMRAYGLSFEDVDAVARCVQHLSGLRADPDAPLGAVAPSFGAGPVLIALSRPQVRDLADFALIFGGYYDLGRTLRYTLTGAYDAEGHRGRVDPSGNRRNRWKFLHGNVGLLSATPGRALLEEIAAGRAEDPERDDGAQVQSLGPAERGVLEFMANEEPERYDALYAGLPPAITAWVDTFSLHHHTAGLRARLLIVHSDADDKVSFVESLALSRDLPGAPTPRLVIVSLFRHMDLALSLDSATALFGSVLPDVLTLWRLSYDLMRLRR